MKTLLKGFLFLSVIICVISPNLVQSNEEHHSFLISENIKNMAEFLEKQDYFLNVSKICHEEECFAIDVHDLKKSLQNVEEKMLRKIEEKLGKDASIQTSLKGFTITKVLTK